MSHELAQPIRPAVVPVGDSDIVFRRPPTGLWQDAWKRLIKNRMAVAGMTILVLLLLLATLASVIAPFGFADQDIDQTGTFASPSARHLLGTDRLGRDVFSRLLYGSRISLAVGFIAQTIIVSVGVPIGIFAGYKGGRLDLLLMRFVDIMYAFPELLFLILVMTFIQSYLGRPGMGAAVSFISSVNKSMGGLLGIFIAFGLTSWLTLARLVRGQTLSVKAQPFVESARSVGATDGQIMRRHVFPNVLAPVVIAAALGVPGAIGAEAGLSFIGLGVQPPYPSWGIMIADGVKAFRSYPHVMLAPGLALAITLLSFNFLGDGLRDALDPLMKR
jgi:oligopeptide transport system permease protein